MATSQQPQTPPLSSSDWVKIIGSMRRYPKHKGGRAPYKPLLMLWLLGRIYQGRPNRVTFEEAEDALAPLMDKYRVGTTKPSVVNPFVRLRSDGDKQGNRIWQLQDPNGVPFSATIRPETFTKTLLLKGVTGELNADLLSALKNTRIRLRVVRTLVLRDFRPSRRNSLLDEVGLGHMSNAMLAPRDPRFRQKLLRAYEFRCTFCGYDGQVNGSTVGLEAAHIRPHDSDGPNETDNGLLLCALHHKLFDEGVLGLDEHRQILVSSDLIVRDTLARVSIMSLVGKPINRPHPCYPGPEHEHVEWHYNNEFRKPALYIACKT